MCSARRFAFGVLVLVAMLLRQGLSLVGRPVRLLSLQQLHASSRINVPPPPAPRLEFYSRLSSRLAAKGEFVALSFFRFAQKEKQRPVTEAESLLRLKEKLSGLGVKGTLLVAANEGYNGAFCVPSKHLASFYQALVDTDSTLFQDLDLNIGECFDSTTLPFKKLVVKQKKAVLTDGLPENVVAELDFTDAGPELAPEAWHLELKQQQQQQPPLILDCRNDYESDMGSFRGATPLNTSSFADTFEKLDELFGQPGADKNQRVLTYCTGGIRCIKVNAYLKQRLGLTNIARLEKGIIHYEQWVEQKRQEEDGKEVERLFDGRNFLFDRRRMAATTTEEEEEQPPRRSSTS